MSQRTFPAEVRAQPAADVFALAEAVGEHEGERAKWEASLAGVTLR